VNLLIFKLSFERIVHEILQNQADINKFIMRMSNVNYRIQSSTLLAFQKITEAFLCEFLVSKCIIHLHYS